MLQRVGGSLGTAIFAVVLQGQSPTCAHATAGRGRHGFGQTYWWVMGITLIALVPTLLLARIERAAHAPAAGRLPSPPIATRRCWRRHDAPRVSPERRGVVAARRSSSSALASASCSAPSGACAAATSTAPSS